MADVRPTLYLHPYLTHSWLDEKIFSWYHRRQFAEWLEELYDDIQELIVCLFPHSYNENGPDKQQANCLYEDTREACMEGASLIAL